MAAASLIKEIRKRYPEFKILLSTVTVTGNIIAKDKIPEADYIIYFPFDFSWAVKRALDVINPIACIIIETELWPNFLNALNLRGIPVVIVNGRISEKSFKGYKLIRPFMKEVFSNISMFNMQTEEDAERAISLGAVQNNVKICGNIKYDHEFREIGTDKVKEIKGTLGINSNEKIFIAGSTHPGEEEIILDLYSHILNDHSNLRLIIAPRHVERVREVEEITRKKGLIPVRRTNLQKSEVRSQMSEFNNKPVIILDTIGELGFMYSIATFVFVGGSLIPHGGQNILEPAFYKKPVIFGKYMMNFSEIAKEMRLSGGGIQVNNKEEFKIEVEKLLNDEKMVVEIGEKGYQVIIRNRGTLQRNLELIKEIIESTKYYYG